MKLLAQATDKKLKQRLGVDEKWGDIVRSLLAIIGTILIAFNIGDITQLEWEQFTQIFMVFFGSLVNIISLISSWFNKEE